MNVYLILGTLIKMRDKVSGYRAELCRETEWRGDEEPYAELADGVRSLDAAIECFKKMV